MSVIRHRWAIRNPPLTYDRREAECHVRALNHDEQAGAREVEAVPAAQLRGPVAENARMRAVMAEAVDEIQNRRVEDAIQMLLNALDARGQ